jgi:serine-type D-Ala-D-Ala carboxypeptidase/endopeptidase
VSVLPPDLVAAVDEVFAGFPIAGDANPGPPKAPGLAYGVLLDGDLVHAGGRGTLRVGAEAPPGADSVFRIASMTKSFVAAAILLLRDRGLLALDDEVRRHVPEAAGLVPPDDGPAPTLRHLLAMTSGLPTDDAWADRLESIAEDELTAIIGAPLTFGWVPGVAFDYSNLGYALLGRTISNVAGEPFHDLIVRELCDPLGLSATRWRAADVDAAHLATGYHLVDDTWEEQPHSDAGAFSAIGGLFSSVRDIAAWMAAYCDAWPPRVGAETSPHPLSRATRREQQRPLATVPPELVRDHRGRLQVNAGGYCMGLFTDEDAEVGRSVSHSGGYPGFGTHMRWHPATGIGVVALANGRYARASAPAAAALGVLVTGLAARRPRVRPAPALVQACADATALLGAWDDELAARRLAPNVAQDEPLARRREAMARIGATHGALQPDGDLECETPLRGTFWLAGERGRVGVGVTLTPETPPRIQHLDLTSVPDAPPALRALAETLVAAASATEPALPAGLACASDAVRAEAARVVQEAAQLLAPCTLGAATGGDGATTARFELRGRCGTCDLEVRADAAAPSALAAVALEPRPPAATPS